MNDYVTLEISKSVQHTLSLVKNKHNKSKILEYSNVLKTEINPSDSHLKNVIVLLCRFCNFHGDKNFENIKRDDVLNFLQSFRKSEARDPQHRWVGTYNLFLQYLLRFFRWIYYPLLDQKKRPKPCVLQNISQLKRKEKSIYKPTDLWTCEDDLLFLKYCPSPRDKCYHMISRDTACRPSELLRLRIKDIVFKSLEGKKYAEILVSGKTGTRQIPLINSLPYVKDWIDNHPQKNNPNAHLICTFKSGRSLSNRFVFNLYYHYRKNIFPKLIENSSVLPEDKNKINELLKKPWNPYIRRHSALTEKSKILKEHILRQYAGWSPNSMMHQRYLHYFGNETSESLLEALGIVTKNQKEVEILRPIQCPNCQENNIIDSKFCSKCRMLLSYNGYLETLEKQKEKDDEMEKMRKEISLIKQGQRELSLQVLVRRISLTCHRFYDKDGNISSVCLIFIHV